MFNPGSVDKLGFGTGKLEILQAKGR